MIVAISIWIYCFVIGKLDKWEWDSGARDMSPVPKSIVKHAAEKYSEEQFKVSLFIYMS